MTRTVLFSFSSPLARLVHSRSLFQSPMRVAYQHSAPWTRATVQPEVAPVPRSGPWVAVVHDALGLTLLLG